MDRQRARGDVVAEREHEHAPFFPFLPLGHEGEVVAKRPEGVARTLVELTRSFPAQRAERSEPSAEHPGWILPRFGRQSEASRRVTAHTPLFLPFPTRSAEASQVRARHQPDFLPRAPTASASRPRRATEPLRPALETQSPSGRFRDHLPSCPRGRNEKRESRARVLVNRASCSSPRARASCAPPYRSRSASRIFAW